MSSPRTSLECSSKGNNDRLISFYSSRRERLFTARLCSILQYGDVIQSGNLKVLGFLPFPLSVRTYSIRQKIAHVVAYSFCCINSIKYLLLLLAPTGDWELIFSSSAHLNWQHVVPIQSEFSFSYSHTRRIDLQEQRADESCNTIRVNGYCIVWCSSHSVVMSQRRNCYQVLVSRDSAHHTAKSYVKEVQTSP